MLTKRLFFLILGVSLCFTLSAQIGKVGINTNLPAAMLHVKDSSVVFTGAFPVPNTPGTPPLNGSGTRMMWYPDKAAFRAGVALGQQWNKDSIGLYSLAIGYDTRAYGQSSVAIGNLIKADGAFSVAIGANNITAGQQSSALGSFLTCSGFWSTALGASNTSSGNVSTAMGAGTKASGWYSTASGRGTIANCIDMFAAGSFNDSTSASNSPFNSSDLDPLFVVGNGSGNFNRKNALTLLKNGKLGLGTITPKTILHLSKGSSGADPNVSAIATFEDNADVSINLLTPSANSSSIYFGNLSNTDHGSILYNAPPVTNGFVFNTNNTDKMVITDVGNVGIGDISPDSKLHVSRGTSGAVYNGTAALIIEDDASSYLQFANPSGGEAGLLSSTNQINVRGGFIFRPDSSVQIRAGGNSTRLSILANGNIGIGTQSPQKLLHVNAGSSGASPFSSSVAVFEDNADAVINLLTPAANESGLYFGNPLNATHGGILYNSTVANGLAFRTNGNSTKMVINDLGAVGIGDNSPNARLHISEGTGGGLYNSNAEVIIEDDDQAYIQFSVPTAEESGILSGNSAASMRSGILFRADSSLQLRSGGNTTRLVATKAGDIGINTLSPAAKLDVNGTAIIGSNGTALTEIIKTTVAKDVASIAANSSLNVDFTVANCATTSTVYISPETDLTAGMIIGYARVSAAGNVRVRFTNTTGAAIDLASMNYYITVIR